MVRRALILVAVLAWGVASPHPVRAAVAFTVTNTNDSGSGSLRQAMLDANASPGADSIIFNIPGAGPHSISPLSRLPDIGDPVLIDGASQPGYIGWPLIELDGTWAGATANGLTIVGGPTTIRALVIDRFGMDGVLIQGPLANASRIVACFIGTDPFGVVARSNGRHGVHIADSGENEIGLPPPALPNVISGNAGWGVQIEGRASRFDRVRGNMVGTTFNGLLMLQNGGGGLALAGGANQNQIGGAALGEGNVISGNGGFAGAAILSGANVNTFEGNFIGTDRSGTAAVPNWDGLYLSDTTGNIIGGLASGARNVISGNGHGGIVLTDDVTNTRIQGNRIGTTAAGTAGLGNAVHGVAVIGVSSTTGGNRILGNVISTNGSDGVLIVGGRGGNVIASNLIGTDLTGTVALGNGANGVELRQAPNNIVGYPALPLPGMAGNVISGNALDGVLIYDLAASGNFVHGNRIGTDTTGTLPVGNWSDGVAIDRGQNNTVTGNTIGANNGNGVSVGSAYPGTTTGNTVIGNWIGAYSAATLSLGNGLDGVLVSEGPNAIGAPGAGNVIAGNGMDGVFIPSAAGVTVQGNFIGTDSGSTLALGNGRAGVELASTATANTIGGTSSGSGNVIAFNKSQGVFVGYPTGTARQNAIRGNSIFSNGAPGIDLNPNGVAPNDFRDPDSGANDLQNYPIVDLAVRAGSQLHISGTFNSTPNMSGFDLEFFDNDACDPSGFGEGRTFIGSTTVSTDMNGDVQPSGRFSVSFASGVPSGHFITATATDPVGNTSEFSPCQEVERVGRPFPGDLAPTASR
jgi:hypothetical protein